MIGQHSSTHALMLPNLDSISLFLCAAKFRSISKAAEVSHISLSAASRRLSLLEQRFGVALLERRADGVVPTAAGEAMVQHAQKLLEQIDAMSTALTDYARGAIGKVHLATNVSAMSHGLPQQLADWSRKYPNIRVEMREERSGIILDLIRQGVADIGIVTTQPVPDLHFEEYVEDPLCAIVPLGLHAEKRKIRFEDLLNDDFIGLDKEAASRQEITRHANALGRSLALRVQVQSFDAMCRLVAADQGVAILPKGVAQGFRKSMNFRLLELEDDWARRKMYVCMRQSGLTQPASHFLEHLLST